MLSVSGGGTAGFTVDTREGDNALLMLGTNSSSSLFLAALIA
jgi:hypothetical protein